jgi:TrmH family RNA methyltransferase
LWHIDVFEGIDLTTVLSLNVHAFALGASAKRSLNDLLIEGNCVAVFGNEARGLATAQSVDGIEQVRISMPGNAESLNLSAAATIVMYHLANMPTS